MASKGPVIAFPLYGAWTAIHSPGHHRYAYDFVAVDAHIQRYFATSWWSLIVGKAVVTDSYSWSQPVYAPFDGVAITVSEGWPDRHDLCLVRDILKAFVLRPKIVAGDIRPFAGNYVLIESGAWVAMLAHLRCGSLQVATGESVRCGQAIGEVGNSGNSVVPHLHFQVMRGRDPLTADIVPFRIKQYERWSGHAWEQVDHGTPEKGDRLRVGGA